jgi:putative membrane protein
MASILVSWLILSVAVYVTALLLPGFSISGAGGAALVAAALGALQWLIGWLLFLLIGVGTLGLGFLLAFVTRWLVTALLLKGIDTMSRSIHIRSFGTALLGAMIMSAIGTVGEALVRAA